MSATVLLQDIVDALEMQLDESSSFLSTPIASGHRSANVSLRKQLDLFVNFRPVSTVPGLNTRFRDLPIDLVIFRENTEDLYSGIEHEVAKGVVESIKVITRTASMRIAEVAFQYAAREGRRKITAIHKANIMKMSDGLFLRCCRETAARFPAITYNEMIVDNACMQLVMRPETFEVLILPNLYGDIVSDLAAGLVGGLGVVPGANLGDSHAMFEAVHGTAPDIAGKGVANPTALMLSAVLMLAHLGEHEASSRLRTSTSLELFSRGTPQPLVEAHGRYTLGTTFTTMPIACSRVIRPTSLALNRCGCSKSRVAPRSLYE